MLTDVRELSVVCDCQTQIRNTRSWVRIGLGRLTPLPLRLAKQGHFIFSFLPNAAHEYNPMQCRLGQVAHATVHGMAWHSTILEGQPR